MNTNHRSQKLTHVLSFFIPLCLGIPLGFYWINNPSMPKDVDRWLDLYALHIVIALTAFAVVMGIILFIQKRLGKFTNPQL